MRDRQKENVHLLEGRYGILLQQVFRFLFSRIDIPEEYKSHLASLAAKGHIVYAHSAKSKTDALLLNYRLQKEGLPVPHLIFGEEFLLYQPVSKWQKVLRSLFKKASSGNEGYIDYIKKGHGASLVCLTGEGPYDNPIVELLKVQRQIDIPIYIVPQRIVYHKSPLRVRDVTKADESQIRGVKKIVTLIRGRDRGFIEHGEPINLLDVSSRGQEATKFIEELAREIRHELLQRIANLGSNVSEAPIRERSFIIRKTIKDPILQSFLKSFATQEKTTTEILEDKANKILDQVAADLNPTYLNLLSRALTWIFNDIFDGMDMDKDSLKGIREAAKKGSLVYVPCHKSHIDYLVLSYGLYHNWMGVPLIAAGINLSFFPMGHILRRGGAFFLKRSFKNDPFYGEVFSAYIRTILGERIPIEFFIEGTRSRSGKLMLPKKGLLSMIIQGWESGVTRDVIFVPVYVGYDSVVEEKSYVREMKGAPKEKENLWQLLQASSILRKRYGKVYVRFAKPIALNEYMKDRPRYSKMDSQDKEDLYDALAQEIIKSIYGETVITPFALLCTVLISQVSAIDEVFAREVFHLYTEYIKFSGYQTSSSLNNIDQAFDDALALFKEREWVTIDKGDGASLIAVKEDHRVTLSYYKNMILNCLASVSLLANVLLKYPHGIDKRRLLEEIEEFAGILEKEFVLEKEGFYRSLEFMETKGLITDSQGMVYIPPEKRKYLKMCDGLIENYLEAYLVVGRNLASAESKKFLSAKDILKAMNKNGARMYKKGEIKRMEALCLPHYKGALDTLKAKSIIDRDNTVIDKKGLENITKQIEAYLEE